MNAKTFFLTAAVALITTLNVHADAYFLRPHTVCYYVNENHQVTTEDSGPQSLIIHKTGVVWGHQTAEGWVGATVFFTTPGVEGEYLTDDDNVVEVTTYP